MRMEIYMRLIRLSANKESFHTVNFSPKGLSLILAKQKSTHARKTYNSVGKSLIIALIHFCLGSNKNSEFEEKLRGWEFSLDFDIGGVKFTSTRSTDKQKVIILNNEELSLANFRKKLESLIFALPETAKNLTFRTLLSRFIRPKKSSYSSYDVFIDKEEPIGQQVNVAFLLGLDANRSLKKYELKKTLDDTENNLKKLDNDELLKEFFGKDEGNTDIELVALEQTVEKLSNNLKSFQIAEDYDQIRKEADKISYQIREVRNKAIIIQNAIKNIEKTLDIRPDITSQDIQNLFNEANLSLGDLIVQKLDELQEFHNKLIDNRTKQLLVEKNKFNGQLTELEKEIKKLSKIEGEKLTYLAAHGALDEYSQINQQLTESQIKLNKVKQYRELKSKYKTKVQEIKRDLSEENLATEQYLEDVNDVIKQNIKLFKSLSSEFYVNKKAGISVTNNEGINQTRFEIKAKIQDDGGDAVNGIKTFCFDWTLLKASHGHNVRFLFHDSRITDGVDSRQVAKLIQIGHEESITQDYQYILSINENTLKDAIQKAKESEPSFDIESITKESTILELSDLSDKEKLLGIQLDLDYEK